MTGHETSKHEPPHPRTTGWMIEAIEAALEEAARRGANLRIAGDRRGAITPLIIGELMRRAMPDPGRTTRRRATVPSHSICMVCGHEWRQHDPEDGRCDAEAVDGSGICQCGRDLAFTQKWNAYLSRMALGQLRTPE